MIPVMVVEGGVSVVLVVVVYGKLLVAQLGDLQPRVLLVVERSQVQPKINIFVCIILTISKNATKCNNNQQYDILSNGFYCDIFTQLIIQMCCKMLDIVTLMPFCISQQRVQRHIIRLST